MALKTQLQQLLKNTEQAGKDFVQGFTDQPGQYTQGMQGVGDAVANATPAGGVEHVAAQGLAHLAPLGGAVIGGIKTLPKVADDTYQGARELTSPILDALKGKSYVSPQFIQDLTKMPGVKQAEIDAANNTLQNFQGMGKIPVNQFGQHMEDSFLPLTTTVNPNGARYESRNLEAADRGNPVNYQENIYQSPIKTSAGGVHFNDYSYDTPSAPNYFAHTRTEDIPSNPSAYMNPDGTYNYDKIEQNPVDTRRVLELQSDLFQKGRLDQEIGTEFPGKLDALAEATDRGFSGDKAKALADKWMKDQEGLNSLKPYENTWHERLIREEVKKAAQDGKTTLQFPTGDTAMKIEGLGENPNFYRGESYYPGRSFDRYTEPLQSSDLKTGQSVKQGVGGESQDWIITDVLGDGKFKAVPQHQIEMTIENDEPMYREAIRTGVMDKDTSEFNIEALKKSSLFHQALKEIPDHQEQFDISGKMDANNPIHKFYESEVGKYLQKKYNAQRITDPQGISWWQVPVNPAATRQPIRAYGVAGGALGAGAVAGQQQNTQQQPPLKTRIQHSLLPK